MMQMRNVSVVLCVLGSSWTCLGQQGKTHIYEVSAGFFTDDLSTAPSMAAGESQLVVAGTHRLMLLNKSMNTVDTRFWMFDHPDPNFPFKPRFDPYPLSYKMALVFPRADYDPIDNRVWMMFSEMGEMDLDERLGGSCSPFIHLAVSKSNSMSAFSNQHWWYYTGEGVSAGNGGEAFDLFLDNTFPTKGFLHFPLRGNAMTPTMSFHEEAIIITPSESFACAPPFVLVGPQKIVIIPRTHEDGLGNPKSILDGDRPDENDMLLIQLDGLFHSDNAERIMSVQEPFEQYPNVNLFISTSPPGSITMDALRLRGVYKGDGPKNWLVRQMIEEVSP